ncbi:MAG TPA: hypothetical protein VFR04_04130 [Solirubrobacterales bacterium]|nr:hypothetical protein [Solirubrobacterales bacterium]
MGVGMAVAAMLLLAGPASAAVYPAGGSGFSGGAEGWQVTSAGCDAEPVCTASGGYDGGNGNPPGSIAANTTVALNLLTLFESNVTLQSPDFTVGDGRLGTLHLDRQFTSGNLVDLAATTTHEVTLIDRTADRESVPLDETIDSASGFVGKDAAVTVVPGHTYAISIAVDASSSVIGTGLLGGTTSTRFDNVELSVPGDGDGNGGRGKGFGDGPGALSNQRLLATIQDSLVAPATLEGKRLFVKARCPAAVGRACRVTIQGLLKRRSAATGRSVAKIAPGKSKRIVLEVKPKARKKVAPRKRLLFKQTVQAGPARATVYKRLKLIRR